MSTDTNPLQPLVSICIPTYNGSKFIKETLDSALNQTYQNFEIVITDDCSSDNTIAICNEYAKKDARIKVYKNEQNLGLVGNWSESVEKATSKWVKFLFQDDLLEANCVETMINAAIQNKVNFVICNREYFFEDNFDPVIKRFYTEKLVKPETIFTENRVYKPEETAQLIAHDVFNNCIGEPPCFLFNKEHYSKDDYPSNYFQMVDFVFILNKILVHDFFFIKEKLIGFRVHTSSESMKNNQVQTGDNPAFKKFIYVQFYERIQICHDLINNPVFKAVKAHIPTEDIIAVKNWTVLKSYKKFGFKDVYRFYQSCDLKDFVINKYTSSYNYLKYKAFKIKHKALRKTYKV